MSFETGDFVKLRVGGPRMIVNHTTSEGFVWCYWFDLFNVCHNGTFRSEILERCE